MMGPPRYTTVQQHWMRWTNGNTGATIKQTKGKRSILHEIKYKNILNITKIKNFKNINNQIFKKF